MLRYIQPKKLLRALTLPIIFLVVLVSMDLLWLALQLPDTAHLIALTRQYFDRYGAIALFLSALVEGALVLGFYFPGGFVIFLGIILAGKDIGKVAEIIGLASLGFTLGLAIDYLLGRYGWYRLFLKLGFKGELDKAELNLHKHGLTAIWLTYWDINLASFTATAAGILRYPLWRFTSYSALALLFWDSVWALMIYLVGAPALDLVSGQGSYAFIVLTVWCGLILVRHILENRRKLLTQ